MLRWFVALLLLANAVFFAWGRGWFAPAWPSPRQAEREPERIAAQLRPDRITVLPPKAAGEAVSAARAAALVCLEAGPIASLAEVDAAEAALAALSPPLPAGSWTRATLAPPPPQWVVTTGRMSTDAVRRRARADQLRRAGVASWDEVPLAEGAAPAWVVSRHATRDEADAALARLAVRGLHVAALPTPAPRYWLRAAGADSALQSRLQALVGSAAPAGGFKPCAAPAR